MRHSPSKLEASRILETSEVHHSVRNSNQPNPDQTVRPYFFMSLFHYPLGWYSSVGIATRYGLDGPRVPIAVKSTFSAPVQTGTKAHPASYTKGTESLYRGYSSRGVALPTHPHPAPRLKKE
jgi:hypothetical protein